MRPVRTTLETYHILVAFWRDEERDMVSRYVNTFPAIMTYPMKKGTPNEIAALCHAPLTLIVGDDRIGAKAVRELRAQGKIIPFVPYITGNAMINTDRKRVRAPENWPDLEDIIDKARGLGVNLRR